MMFQLIRFAFLCLLMTIMTSVSYATVTVTGSAAIKQVVPVPDSPLVDVFIVHTNPLISATAFVHSNSNAPIRNIVISNNTIQILQVTIGRTGTPPFGPIAKLGSIEQIFLGTNNGPVLIFDIQTEGDVGFIQSNRLFAADINGAITGGIEIVDYGGSVQPPGMFDDFSEFIIRGDLLGNVIIDGRIQNTLSVIGSVGTPSSPVFIAVGDAVKRPNDGIRRIEAGEINATFVNFHGNAAVATIASIATDTANGGSGDFNGLIYAGNIDSFSGQSPEFVFDADMNGDIWISESLDSGDLIEVSAGALKGQVIIGFDITPGTATWNGVVSVGGSALAGPPFYSDLPSAIGGGAVGLVPFSNHGPASTPPATTATTAPAAATSQTYNIGRHARHDSRFAPVRTRIIIIVVVCISIAIAFNRLESISGLFHHHTDPITGTSPQTRQAGCPGQPYQPRHRR